MSTLTKTEKRMLELAGRPPKRLYEFVPFVLPVALITVLLVVHAILFWHTAQFGAQGLYIHDGRHYVEVLEDARGFVLGSSFLIIIAFGITSLLAHTLWQYRRVMHELWHRLQEGEALPNQALE